MPSLDQRAHAALGKTPSVRALPRTPSATRPRPVLPTITRITPATTEEWARTWLATPQATFFQSPDWAQAWSAYRPAEIEPIARCIQFSDGVHALLPACRERQAQGLLTRRIAAPGATFGGWLAATPLGDTHCSLLLREFLRADGTSLVWRLNPYDRGLLDAACREGLWCKADVTHTLPLRAGPAALMAEFKNGYRSDIQRARKQGRIQVVEATTQAEWRAYYRVYENAMLRWNLPENEAHGWPLFAALHALRSPHIKLWLGLYDGAVVSGELCFYAQRHAVSWHAATLDTHLKTHVAKVQLMHVIEHAHTNGHDYFDFNPSASLPGVRTFKEGFAATPIAAPLVYVDDLRKRCARRLARGLGLGGAHYVAEPIADVRSRNPLPGGGVSERRPTVEAARSARLR
jgi:hypothetical protein